MKNKSYFKALPDTRDLRGRRRVARKRMTKKNILLWLRGGDDGLPSSLVDVNFNRVREDNVLKPERTI